MIAYVLESQEHKPAVQSKVRYPCDLGHDEVIKYSQSLPPPQKKVDGPVGEAEMRTNEIANVRQLPPDTDLFGPDASNYVRSETPSDAHGSGGQIGRPAHARYSFEATGEGELALTAGMELEVLDDSDQAYVLYFHLIQQY